MNTTRVACWLAGVTLAVGLAAGGAILLTRPRAYQPKQAPKLEAVRPPAKPRAVPDPPAEPKPKGRASPVSRQSVRPAAKAPDIETADLRADEPIPQDAARQVVQRRRVREYLRRDVVAPYETVGRQDPRWDTDACSALQAFAEYLAAPHDMLSDHWLTALEHARKAVEADCDDPFIRYLSIRYDGYDYCDSRKERAQAQRRHDCDTYREVVRDMLASGYPATRKGHACVNAAAMLLHCEELTSELRGEVERLLENAISQIVVILRSGIGDERAREDAFDLCRCIMESGRTLTKDRLIWRDRVLAALTDTSFVAFRRRVEGNFYIDYAWDARGTGWAHTVTDEGWRRLYERLELAEAALTAAWEADPACADVAAKMTIVCMGLGHNRETMEKWFQRAIDADGDSLDACNYKMNYLLPKWLGSDGEALQFGRQCCATRNWSAGLPLILVGVHQELRSTPPNREYFHSNLTSKWRDIQSVYRPLLDQYPQARRARTDFFKWACQAGMKDAAEELLAGLNNDPWKLSFDSNYEFRWFELWATGQRPWIE
jgi:hypothetical protein